jgi:hypothetical protein
MKIGMIAAGFLVAVMGSMALAADEGNEISVATMPPVVVKTVPEAGSLAVDPKITEIRVTFSKEMMDRSWSFVQASPDEYFPGTADGKPHYLADHRTIVFPVKLQPNHSYVLWLNDPKFNNFMDTQKHRAVPYLLVFKTKP